MRNIPATIKKGASKQNMSANMIVFQHNNLIEAKYSLTLQEKKIIMWLVSQIQPDNEEFKKHVISLKDLMKLMDLEGESYYSEMKKITFNLVQKGLRIIDISSGTEVQLTWLSCAIYDAGTVQLSIHPNLQPYLLQLKSRFTTINLSDLMQFSSIHAIRIYELLKQHYNTRERTMSIEYIKRCCGVENKLKQFVHFERYLLLIAQREINEKSDIYFDFEKIKLGRKIVSIKFIIKENKAYKERQGSIKKAKKMKHFLLSFDKLKGYGLSKQRIKKIIQDNSKEVIQKAIQSVDVQIKKGKVKNKKAMICAAINERWELGKYISRQ